MRGPGRTWRAVPLRAALLGASCPQSDDGKRKCPVTGSPADHGAPRGAGAGDSARKRWAEESDSEFTPEELNAVLKSIRGSLPHQEAPCTDFCIFVPSESQVEEAEPSDAVVLDGLRLGRLGAGRGALLRRLR